MDSRYTKFNCNLLKSKLVMCIVVTFIGSLTSVVAQADQNKAGSTGRIHVSITKLPPPLIVNSYECKQGVCASIDTSSNIVHVVCDARANQLPACMYSPE